MNNHCGYIGTCGGCDRIGTEYAVTLQEKQACLQSLLGDFSPVSPIIGMQDPLHYRNKVHRVLVKDRKGRILSGIYQTGTHRVTAVDNCLIEDGICQRVIAAVRDLIVSFRLPVYDEDRGTGLVRHIVARRGFATGEIMVILVMTSSVFPGKHRFLQELLKVHPEITTVVLNLNVRRTTMVLGERNIILYGPGYINDILCGLKFRLGPVSFFQVNPVQTELLYGTAVEYASLTSADTVIDAYCGTGTIGLTAARSAGRVIGVELNADAVKDAGLNAKQNGITNASFFQGDAGDFMDSLTRRKEHADVVMMDPPRSGSTEKFLSSCVSASPRSVVYISCGPETLKRDLSYFVKHGYAVRRIQPVDMFPFTPHIETVTLLTKADPCQRSC